MAGSRRTAIVVRTNLHGRLPLPRARRAPRRAGRSSSRRAASIRRRARAARLRRGRDAVRAAGRPAGPGRLRARRRPSVSRSRAPHAVRRDQARRPSCCWPSTRPASACRRSSTAAGSSPGPGRWARSTRASSPTGWLASTSAGRCLHRVRRRRQAGPRPAARRSISSTSSRTSSPRPTPGPAHVVNVGGGAEVSLSLRETTELCREITGHELELGSVRETRAGDVRVYLSDCRALSGYTDWRPRRSPTRGARRHLHRGSATTSASWPRALRAS